MDNIFKHAKFGDPFYTEDERMAIYHKSVMPSPSESYHHLLLVQDEDDLVKYNSEGMPLKGDLWFRNKGLRIKE